MQPLLRHLMRVTLVALALLVPAAGAHAALTATATLTSVSVTGDGTADTASITCESGMTTVRDALGQTKAITGGPVPCAMLTSLSVALAGGDDTVNLFAMTPTEFPRAAITGRGDAGADRLLGGATSDTLDGGVGEDSIDGQGGNDTIVGGGDADTMAGGPGDDAIRARDGIREVLDCDEGYDFAEVDLLDRRDRCEVVDVPVGDIPPSPAIDKIPPAVLVARPTLTSNGTLRAQLTCPADEIRCTGNSRFEATFRDRTRKKTRRVRVAVEDFNLGRGQVLAVRDRIPRSTFISLRRARSFKLTIRLRVRDDAGNERVTVPAYRVTAPRAKR